MTRASVLASVLLMAALACRNPQPHPGRTLGIERYPSARDLYVLADAYRVKHKLAALGIGIIHRDRVVGLGMAGERAAGSMNWAAIDDAFDVASCSKSVTATVAAILVEQGQVRWETTVSEVFPELKDVIHPGYAGLTLELLLRHRAGLDHEMNRNLEWSGWHHRHITESPSDQRFRFTAAALTRPPRYRPGTDTFYSSDGYLIAGSMLERAAGMDWALLARNRVFQPLGLETMRYGAMSTDGTAPQVSGHEPAWFGRSRMVPPDPDEYGRHPFGSPAGFLYTSVPDLLRYVGFHIQGWNEGNSLLGQASFRRLHNRINEEPYALGWEAEVKRDEAGRVYEHSVHHGGYSGRSRANIWFTPETQWGTVIVTNDGRGDDDAMIADIFYALLREYGLLPPATAP